MRIVHTLPGLCMATLAACSSVPPSNCQPGTLNLHVALRLDAAAADTITIRSMSPPLSIEHARNPAANDLGEVDIVVAFPNGYPAGSLVDLTVTASAMGQPLASAIAQIHLQPVCTEGAISLFDTAWGPPGDGGGD